MFTKNSSDKSQIFAAWREDVSVSGAGAPFAVSFYSLRLRLTSEDPIIIKTRRTLHLGLCFPRSCTPRAVGALVAGTSAPLLRHAVLAVRSPDHAAYSYIQDNTFRVLL
ncbi:hypothetical protein EVAR_17820_1 [Eumeta japonica]|uniref:Uncharacterized protein n=1 Tax=Eumeta variegata TaxID=151549 RepID=A0A4C1TTV4_EUMVA|nr:hypothetical protein EVAR_17820_1 [Eumeta japonica]